MLRRSYKKTNIGPSRRLSKEHIHKSFSPELSPAISISRGETIIVETQDCYGGLLTEDPTTYHNTDQSNGIPLTGPIYVEEAHIGDVLSIQVKDIKMASSGIFAIQPEGGISGQDIQGKKIRVLEVDEKTVKIDDGLTLPVNPVIGNLGVAAKHGEMDTTYPGRHGGNLDTMEITTGSRIYLPVQVNGALLSLGDVKACLGDGQIAGCGVEIEAEITLRVDTLPGGRFSWPRVELKGEWITITSASTADQAARLAITEMVKWISQEKGLDYDTAYTLVSLGGALRFSQWDNPLISARMIFPKRLITKLKSVSTASGHIYYRPLPPLEENQAIDGKLKTDSDQVESVSNPKSGLGRPPHTSSRGRQSGNQRRSRNKVRKVGHAKSAVNQPKEAPKNKPSEKESITRLNENHDKPVIQHTELTESADPPAKYPNLEQNETTDIHDTLDKNVDIENNKQIGPTKLQTKTLESTASNVSGHSPGNNSTTTSEEKSEFERKVPASFGRKQRTIRKRN